MPGARQALRAAIKTDHPLTITRGEATADTEATGAPHLIGHRVLEAGSADQALPADRDRGVVVVSVPQIRPLGSAARSDRT